MAWEELLEITPGMFLSLIKRKSEHEKREFFPFACLMSMYVNAHRKDGSPPTSPDDFMPKVGKAKPKQANKVGLGPEVFLAFQGAFSDGTE